MPVQHRPLNASERSELDEFLNHGLALLGAERGASDLLERVDSFVVSKQTAASAGAEAPLNDDDMIELSWSVGSVLGSEFEERLNWVWSLIGGDETGRFGIVSPNGALALYPSFFVRDCLEEPSRDFTALLIYNMVDAGRFDDVPPGACLDLAENVVRIVPR